MRILPQGNTKKSFPQGSHKNLQLFFYLPLAEGMKMLIAEALASQLRRRNFTSERIQRLHCLPIMRCKVIFTYLLCSVIFFRVSVCASRTETQTVHTGLLGLPSEGSCATANHYQVSRLCISLANTAFYLHGYVNP